MSDLYSFIEQTSTVHRIKEKLVDISCQGSSFHHTTCRSPETQSCHLGLIIDLMPKYFKFTKMAALYPAKK